MTDRLQGLRQLREDLTAQARALGAVTGAASGDPEQVARCHHLRDSLRQVEAQIDRTQQQAVALSRTVRLLQNRLRPGRDLAPDVVPNSL